MFLKIDTFVLDRIFTPFAWWFERETGRTRFFLAWATFALLILGALFQLDIGLRIIRPISFGGIGASFFGFMAAACFMFSSGMFDQEVRAGLSPDLSGPIPLWFNRACGWILLLIGIHRAAGVFLEFQLPVSDPRAWSALLELVANAAYFCGSYLISVKSPPPFSRIKDLEPAMMET